MTRALSLSLLALSLCGCGLIIDDRRTTVFESAPTANIDLVNEDSQAVEVYLDGAFAEALGPGDSARLEVNPGNMSISVRYENDPSGRRLPLANLSLSAGQLTLVTIRSAVGDRELFDNEAAFTVQNETSLDIAIFINGHFAGDVPAMGAQTFIVPTGVGLAIGFDVLGDSFQTPQALAYLELGPQQRSLLPYR